MPKLFKNKYRVESTRLKGWDYSRNGYYFVTICSKNCECHFGNVIDGKMVLSEIGKIILDEWLQTAVIRSNIILFENIIMPNHLHGIIGISDSVVETHCNASAMPVETHCNASAMPVETHCNASAMPVETHCNASLPTTNSLFIPAGNDYKNKFGPQSNNLSSIIRGFKGSSKKQINKIYGENFFNWQSRFYDHIIRNETVLNKIRKYIIDNPFRWHLDRNNPDGLWM